MIYELFLYVIYSALAFMDFKARFGGFGSSFETHIGHGRGYWGLIGVVMHRIRPCCLECELEMPDIGWCY